MEVAYKDYVPEVMDAEDPFYSVYFWFHRHAQRHGTYHRWLYGVHSLYLQNVFQYRENDIFWCTADIGWITGHSYILYGPLANGATTVLFEGVPSYPDFGRFWQIIEKHKITLVLHGSNSHSCLGQGKIGLCGSLRSF